MWVSLVRQSDSFCDCRPYLYQLPSVGELNCLVLWHWLKSGKKLSWTFLQCLPIQKHFSFGSICFWYSFFAHKSNPPSFYFLRLMSFLKWQKGFFFIFSIPINTLARVCSSVYECGQRPLWLGLCTCLASYVRGRQMYKLGIHWNGWLGLVTIVGLQMEHSVGAREEIRAIRLWEILS